MTIKLNNVATAYCLRGAIIAVMLAAATMVTLLASQPAAAEQKQPTAREIGNQVINDRMKSSNRHAEAVRSLL